MLYIYLDQNKWVDLARAAHNSSGGEPALEALEAARNAVREDRARFPLSMAHYMETWNCRDDTRRNNLASTMWDLAAPSSAIGPCTMLNLEDIIAAELEACLARRAGQEPPRHVPIFGDGWHHLMADPAADPALGPTNVASLERFREKALLFKYAFGEPIPEGNDAHYFDVSQRFLQFETALRATFDQQRLSPGQRRGQIARHMVQHMMSIIMDVVRRTDSDPGLLGGTTDEEVIQLVSELPSQRVYFEMMVRTFDNPQFPRNRGDMDDFACLSTATVYCDVVVTEGQWTHIIKQTRLDREHNTMVLSDVRDLTRVLVTKPTG